MDEFVLTLWGNSKNFVSEALDVVKDLNGDTQVASFINGRITVVDVSNPTEKLWFAEKGLFIIVKVLIGGFVLLIVMHGHAGIDRLSHTAKIRDVLLIESAKIIAEDIFVLHCRYKNNQNLL